MGLHQRGYEDGTLGQIITDIFEIMVPEDQAEYLEGYRTGSKRFFDKARAFKLKCTNKEV